jgi:hypothetical protein
VSSKKTTKKGTAYEELCKKLNKHERGTPEDADAILAAVLEMRRAERARARGKSRRKTGS